MKIVATVKFIWENSPNPDHWVMKFESRVFDCGRSLNDVLSWARTYDKSFTFSDIVISEYTGVSI
jgi:hypothetical protein